MKAPERRSEARTLLEAGCAAEKAGERVLAVRYYWRAASFGSPEAKINLGNLYSEGTAVARNFRLAKQLYKSAFRSGIAYGATALGLQYRMEGNAKLAKTWFTRAARMGEELAMKELAKPAVDPGD